MKILLTNLWLEKPGGTETWTLTMATELVRLGHDVSVFTLFKGPFADRFPCPVQQSTRGKFDLIIANHKPCWEQIKLKTAIRMFTSHSYLDSLDDLEGFPEDAPMRVAATKEIQVKRGGHVIYNGIDCERFRPIRPINKTLKNILYLGAFQDAPAFKHLRQTCRNYNLILSQGREATPELINEADLVFSYGRGAMEAMACARNVVSVDCRSYMPEFLMGAGTITPANMDRLKTHGFTGRNDPLIYSWAGRALEDELNRYRQKRGALLRQMVVERFDIKKTAQQYLELAEKSW